MTNKLIYFIILFLSSTVFSWGFKGHQAIATLAKANLTPSTIAKIKVLQNQDSLEKLSIWPDTIRFYYPKTTTWHYGVLESSSSIPKNNKKSGMIYQKTCENINILNSKEPMHWQEKHRALSWVIHLIGDAHQPLHIGNGKDYGGNTCNVFWFKRKKPINFHKIWDNYLVKYTLRTNSSLTTLNIKTADLIAPPSQWLKESRQLHSIIYPKNPNKYCNHKNPKNFPHLSNQYADKMKPIVTRRIQLASKRLAYILNYIFDEKFQKTHKKPLALVDCLHFKLAVKL